MKDSYTVTRPERIGGTIRVPGDKSISHRAAMLAGLVKGRSHIRGFLCSEDCLNTLHAMEQLGAVVERSNSDIVVHGVGVPLSPPTSQIDLGNSGTGIRLLSGILAGQPFESELSGDASLRTRPMGRIQDPLVQMGADVALTGETGCPPIRIRGGSLVPIDYVLPMASAQVKSCVLLAGLFAEGRTSVVEPRPTRDHTERLLELIGVSVTRDGACVSVAGGAHTLAGLKPIDLDVPGDFSSAAFWLAAAASRPGACIRVDGVGLNPRRTAFLDVLGRMGATVDIDLADPDAAEPCGSVVVTGRGLKGVEVGGDEIPNLIDELPLVGFLAALADGETVIRDAAELRVKESNRIATTVDGLCSLGVRAKETADGLVVTGGTVRGGGMVQSHGDHRIAMGLAVLALNAEQPVCIDGIACVDTSYPGFWHDCEALCNG